MTKLPPLPEPQYIDNPHHDAMSYAAEQVQAYGQACREQALLDAMNATRAFGKTGEVIAAVIRGLK